MYEKYHVIIIVVRGFIIVARGEKTLVDAGHVIC
jgi:hypothetical protein